MYLILDKVSNKELLSRIGYLNPFEGGKQLK